MNQSDSYSPERFRFLATLVAGRALDVTVAAAGQPAHTNGNVVLVSAGGSEGEHRREVLVQAALLGAGSLDQRLMRGLRVRPGLGRRYLYLEGHRVLAELAMRIPLAAGVVTHAAAGTSSAEESLEIARGRTKIADPPEWFGVIKPSLLLTKPDGPGTGATDNELRLEFDPVDLDEEENDDTEGESLSDSKILKLFESPLFNSRVVSDFLRKLLGGSRSPGDSAAGEELQVRAVRRSQAVGAEARPLQVPIRFTDDDAPGAAVGVRGAFYPEWDVHHHRYRPEWCRVIDFPLTPATEISAANVQVDDVLRRRLSRVGLGPKALRARPDGDDLDLEALIDLLVDLRSGHSPAENVYLATRKLARNLGVLVLLDASGSATDTDPGGLTVHDHQRRAAATLAVTLEELGDRVAVYGFRSQTRHAVHLLRIKGFNQRFSAVGRGRLNQLQSSGYTRLGAGIRGAGEILKHEAGTPNRLLVVLSDGYPYDTGYEGKYAEADTRKALDELRTDGVACLCLSIGAPSDTGILERVFGATTFASAASLADLSPRMDELFLTSLRELSAPLLSKVVHR